VQFVAPQYWVGKVPPGNDFFIFQGSPQETKGLITKALQIAPGMNIIVIAVFEEVFQATGTGLIKRRGRGRRAGSPIQMEAATRLVPTTP